MLVDDDTGGALGHRERFGVVSALGLDEVCDMLGHSSPTITLSIYAHALPGMGSRGGCGPVR